MLRFVAVADINHRMHSFRSDFGRLKNVGPSGRGEDGEVDPNKLHYKDRRLWERLCFLKDFVSARPNRSSTKVSLNFMFICMH